jgi:hypothetical protein
MASLASINIKFTADLKGFSTEMQTALRQIDKAGQQFQKIGRSMSTFVTLPILAAGAAAIKFASDYNESLNKVDVSFKGSSDEVKAFAKTTLQSFGIAEGTALDLASSYGDMGTSLGLTTGAAAKMSTSLVGLAGDLSSFKNIGIDQANTALTGIFTGETESLKKLGIVMTVAALQQFAYSNGIQKTVDSMSQAEKVQLRYNYILSVTKNSQGDFIRTQGGAANQMRIFQETLKQVAQQFGSIILPAFTGLLTSVNGLITGFGNLSEGTKKTIIIVAGIAAVMGPALVVLGSLASLLPVLATGFALLTGPIGLTIAGIAAIAYIVAKNWGVVKETLADVANYFVDLYNSSLVFRGGVEAIAVVFKYLWATVKGIFQAMISTAQFVVRTIFNAFSTLGKLIKGVLTFDVSGIKDALKKGFDDGGKSADTFFKEIKANSKATSDGLAKDIKSAIDKTVNGNKLEKIIFKKEDVDASGVADAIEESAGTGAGKAGKIIKEKLDGLNFSLQSPTASGSIADYDAQIAQLKEFRDQVATTAEQIKQTDDAIAALEFGKTIKFDPSSIIKATETTETMMQRLASAVSGAKASIAPVIYDISAAVGDAVTQLANNLATGFGEAVGGLIAGTANIGNVMQGMLGMIANFMADLGKQLVAIGIARIAFDKIAISGIGAVIAGTALIALASVFQATLNKGPKPQAFAEGGIVGGTSYYGDKILARVNSSELILNTDQQKSLYGAMNSGGGGTTIIPSLKISGSDLLVVFNRATSRQNRIG